MNEASSRQARVWFAMACLSMMVAVVAGAWSAHGLEGKISVKAHKAFDTGVRYQMWHSLAILALAGSRVLMSMKFILLIFTGMVIFSGSLYLYALSGQKFFGMVTPFGGLILILSWLTLGAKVLFFDKIHK